MSFGDKPIKEVNEMTVEELQAEVEKLDQQKPEWKAYLARVKAVTFQLHNLAGAGHHWQDKNNLVWLTEEVSGTYVDYNPLRVHRTRDTSRGETKGDVSMTKARDLGYVVEGK